MFRFYERRPLVNIIEIIVLLIICFALTDCSVLTGPRVWRQTGPDVPELSVFDETMKDFMVSRKVSAGSLAITYKSRLVFARGYTWSKADSPATEPTSLFRIASLSKPITSAGILKLVENNQLSLDDKVMDILPFGTPEGKNPDPNLGKVTILHLLEHLGGWDRDKIFDPMFADKKISKALDVPLPVTQADIIIFMNGQPLQYVPGTKFAYSNFGYCMLGRVIEQKTGLSYEGYIKKFILLPLGITRMQIGHSNLEKRHRGKLYMSQRKNLPMARSAWKIWIRMVGGWLQHRTWCDLPHHSTIRTIILSFRRRLSKRCSCFRQQSPVRITSPARSIMPVAGVLEITATDAGIRGTQAVCPDATPSWQDGRTA